MPLSQKARSQTLGRDEEGNCTLVAEFILLGFSETPEQRPLLFVIFLMIYITTLMGNLGMIILIRISAQLHTPMYFFLCNLSVADICYSSGITPWMLMSFLTGHKSISFSACFAQLYIFVALVCTECFLLATMACDRYMAICNPLIYSTIMSQNTCVTLVAGSGLLACTNAMLTVCFLSSLQFCDSNIIRHFFCDTPPLIALSSDHYVTEKIISFLAGYTTLGSLVIILFSYVLILTAILKIRSAQGRRKAFSTCTSHLTAVSVFYGTLIFTYLRPNTSYLLGRDQVASVFYTVVVPMLNPMIYTLRNKEVKEAFKKSIRMRQVLG